ncbi:MAG: MoxR family ATPase, partial [Pseudomonadota bacterium]
MAVRRIPGLDGPEALAEALREAQYLADEELATAAWLALSLGKPLLLEGAPGVGKTEAAKAIASILARRRSPRSIAGGSADARESRRWPWPPRSCPRP